MKFNEVRSMEALKKTAEKRPAGYIEDVLSHCEWYNNDQYKISEENFMKLKRKYSSTHKPKQQLTQKQPRRRISRCAVKTSLNPLDTL